MTPPTYAPQDFPAYEPDAETRAMMNPTERRAWNTADDLARTAAAIARKLAQGDPIGHHTTRALADDADRLIAQVCEVRATADQDARGY